MARLISRLAKSLACLLLVSQAGCHALWIDDIDPVYEIDDEAYMVVYPFKTPDFRSAWDSPTGHELAARTTGILRAEAEFRVVPYDEVLELMVARASDENDEANDESIGIDVKKLTPAKLADLVGADYVMVCDVTRFETQDPLNVNMIRATGKTVVRLFSVAEGEEEKAAADEDMKRAERIRKARQLAGLATSPYLPDGGSWVAENRVTAHFPDDYLSQYGVPFMEAAEARRGLILSLSGKVAELYYSHEPDKLAND